VEGLDALSEEEDFIESDDEEKTKENRKTEDEAIDD